MEQLARNSNISRYNRHFQKKTKKKKTRVSLKPDRKTADKTAKINTDGRASCMTARPHTMRALREKFTTRRYVVFFAQQAQPLYLFTKTRQYELVFPLLAYIYAKRHLLPTLSVKQHKLLTEVQSHKIKNCERYR